jgi:hypothetical protein
MPSNASFSGVNRRVWQILEWQAAHTKITWISWGIVWGTELAILFWPRRIGG